MQYQTQEELTTECTYSNRPWFALAAYIVTHVYRTFLTLDLAIEYLNAIKTASVSRPKGPDDYILPGI